MVTYQCLRTYRRTPKSQFLESRRALVGNRSHLKAKVTQKTGSHSTHTVDRHPFPSCPAPWTQAQASCPSHWCLSGEEGICRGCGRFLSVRDSQMGLCPQYGNSHLLPPTHGVGVKGPELLLKGRMQRAEVPASPLLLTIVGSHSYRAQKTLGTVV